MVTRPWLSRALPYSSTFLQPFRTAFGQCFSVFEYGIVMGCIVLEKVSVHLANALAMFALSDRHRISSCAKRNQDQRWPPSLYKV